MWDLPRPGTEPVYTALASRLLTTGPRGESRMVGINLMLQGTNFPKKELLKRRKRQLSRKIIKGTDNSQKRKFKRFLNIQKDVQPHEKKTAK